MCVDLKLNFWNAEIQNWSLFGRVIFKEHDRPSTSETESMFSVYSDRAGLLQSHLEHNHQMFLVQNINSLNGMLCLLKSRKDE